MALFRVAGAVRLADGRIVVADGVSSSLKVFDAHGSLQRTLGGAGEGPGEFRGLNLFTRLRSDSLIVFDFQLGRLTIFDPTFAVAREVRIGAAANSPRANIIGVFADASMIGRGFVDLGGRSPSGLERHASVVYHIASDGTTKAMLHGRSSIAPVGA
jgi:hypothetical protein